MTDIVDKANDDYERWLAGKIAQNRKNATADTDCVDCGEPIGEKRKQAVPWAVRCHKCQTVHEGVKK